MVAVFQCSVVQPGIKSHKCPISKVGIKCLFISIIPAYFDKSVLNSLLFG